MNLPDKYFKSQDFPCTMKISSSDFRHKQAEWGKHLDAHAFNTVLIMQYGKPHRVLMNSDAYLRLILEE